MATRHPRVLWKGAISFGLVHIPIALYPATSEQGLNFDWLDKRSMDPVGYKRINKKTGKEIARENIVKGLEYEAGRYVVLSPAEIEAAHPEATQTIEIETFVDAGEIPFIYLDRPYYVAPINRGAKVYALLREILRKTGKAGIARVVIQTRQHLALLIPWGSLLVLNLLRWGDEIRAPDDIAVPAEGVKAAGLTAAELKMGEQLVAEMTTEWDPNAFTDSFRTRIMEMVEAKVKAGKVETVAEVGRGQAAPATATIYDLTELLKRSLEQGGKSSKSAAKTNSPPKNGRKSPPTRKSA